MDAQGLRSSCVAEDEAESQEWVCKAEKSVQAFAGLHRSLWSETSYLAAASVCACSLRASALSVRSQANPLPERPK